MSTTPLLSQYEQQSSYGTSSATLPRPVSAHRGKRPASRSSFVDLSTIHDGWRRWKLRLSKGQSPAGGLSAASDKPKELAGSVFGRGGLVRLISQPVLSAVGRACCAFSGGARPLPACLSCRLTYRSSIPMAGIASAFDSWRRRSANAGRIPVDCRERQARCRAWRPAGADCQRLERLLLCPQRDQGLRRSLQAQGRRAVREAQPEGGPCGNASSESEALTSATSPPDAQMDSPHLLQLGRLRSRVPHH